MKPVRTEIIIPAPAEAVWRVITDFEDYHAWNSFTPRITLRNRDFAVGAEFDLDCRMSMREFLENEHETVLAIEPERFGLCMGTSRTRGRPGIKSFRWQICEPLEDGRTRFINYEEFRGPLAPLVYALYAKKLKTAFEAYCDALRSRVESLSAG